MRGKIIGRSASEMPGLDIAEQRSWQNYLDSALRLTGALNRGLAESHNPTLVDVRLLEVLVRAPNGSAWMGDLAAALLSLPSRLTRQVRRLEAQGLVARTTSPEDGRGVLATTVDGQDAVEKAMETYSQAVRTHFLDQLSRPQIAAMGENCRRISSALQGTGASTGYGHF